MPLEWTGGVLPLVPYVAGNLPVEYEPSSGSTTGRKVIYLDSFCFYDSGKQQYIMPGRNGDNMVVYIVLSDCSPESQATAPDKFKAQVSSYLNLGSALKAHPDFVGIEGFKQAVGTRFAEGTYVDTLIDGTPDPYVPPGGGGGGGGPPPPAGGGTDWGSAPGDAETSCSIIDIPCNLRRLFVPDDEWSTRWAGLTTQRNSKIPFGYFDAAAGGLSVNTMYDRDHLFQGAMPAFHFGGVQVLSDMPFTITLSDSEAFVWWHENGRMWLWWFFLASFPFVVFRYAMS
jgi:hypothetical protein